MRFQFIKLLLLIGIALTFVKVYQHNLYVKALYALQYVQREKSLLRSKKGLLQVHVSKQCNAEKLYLWATQDRGMQLIKLDRVITITGVLHGA